MANYNPDANKQKQPDESLGLYFYAFLLVWLRNYEHITKKAAKSFRFFLLFLSCKGI